MQLEAVVAYRLHGYGNQEIAQSLGCSRRTVERLLALIRQIWQEAAA